MTDFEFYRAPENWPQPPDEDGTLLSAAHPTISPKKQKKSSSAKQKRKLSESLAGVTAAAVAVVALAGSLPEQLLGLPSSPNTGVSSICPVCKDASCPYYDSSDRVQGIRISMDEEPVFTNLTDIYDMSGFSHADEEGRQFAGSVRLEDGSRMLCIFETDLRRLLGPGSRWYEFEYNCDLRYPDDPAQVGRFYTAVDEKSGDEHFIYVGLLYMPDGSYPDEIPMVLPAYYPEGNYDNVVMEVVTVEHTENYYVIAVTDMGSSLAKDLMSYVTALPVTTAQMTYSLGSTMMFAEVEGTQRTFNDFYSNSCSMLYYTSFGEEKAIRFIEYDFPTKSYGLDFSSAGSAELLFASVSWVEIFKTWQALNEKAPDTGHEVYFQVHSLGDLEVNDITYLVYAVYSESSEEEGYYEIWYYYIPSQEQTIAFIDRNHITFEDMDAMIEQGGTRVTSYLLDYILEQITLA